MEADDPLVYVIIYGFKDKRLRSFGTVYETWELADKAAKQHAIDFKTQCWIMEFPDPRHDDNEPTVRLPEYA